MATLQYCCKRHIIDEDGIESRKPWKERISRTDVKASVSHLHMHSVKLAGIPTVGHLA